MSALTWMCTHSGKQFYPLMPNPELIDIDDIAHALSHLCRWAGHVDRFYSVAEHSCRVAALFAKPKLALYGLLHDAAEAYLVDVPRGIKHTMREYVVAEERLLRMIVEKYGLAWPIPRAIKIADNRLLATEWRDLMDSGRGLVPLGNDAPPLEHTIRPWSFESARVLFRQRFDQLMETYHAE